VECVRNDREIMERGQKTLTRVILFTTVGDASHMIRAGLA
jgi:hypothetical protein